MLQQECIQSPELQLGREREPNPTGWPPGQQAPGLGCGLKPPFTAPLSVGLLSHHPGRASAGFFHNLEVWMCPSHACSSKNFSSAFPGSLQPS